MLQIHNTKPVQTADSAGIQSFHKSYPQAVHNGIATASLPGISAKSRGINGMFRARLTI